MAETGVAITLQQAAAIALNKLGIAVERGADAIAENGPKLIELAGYYLQMKALFWTLSFLVVWVIFFVMWRYAVKRLSAFAEKLPIRTGSGMDQTDAMIWRVIFTVVFYFTTFIFCMILLSNSGTLLSMFNSNLALMDFAVNAVSRK